MCFALDGLGVHCLQPDAMAEDSDTQQLRLELAGYQSCCKKLGDDLATKEKELEGQSRPLICTSAVASHCNSLLLVDNQHENGIKDTGAVCFVNKAAAASSGTCPYCMTAFLLLSIVAVVAEGSHVCIDSH